MEPLNNNELWVTIPCKGMPYETEMDMCCYVFQSVNAQLEESKELSPSDIMSMQKLTTKFPLWIIYCANKEVKVKILSAGSVSVDGRQYELRDYNQTNFKSTKQSIRISINGLPFSISDEELEVWVDTWATRSSRIMRSKAKVHNQGHNMFSHVLSGHRFCYVTAIKTQQPRFGTYGIPNPVNTKELIETQISVYYENQKVNCRKCYSYEHQAKDCGSNNVRNPNLEIFRGKTNPLSNFYPVDLMVEEITFTSVEQLYQYTKASFHGRDDLAEKILKSTTPRSAQVIGDSINEVSDDWDGECSNIMKRLLALKFQESEDFRNKIEDTGNKIIVEGTSNTTWGSGLSPSLTASTRIDDWPGSNRLGFMLMELRTVMFSKATSEEKNMSIRQEETTSSETQQKRQPSSSQVDQDDVVEVAGQLLDKAMNPQPDQLPSPDILKKADKIIDNSNAQKKEKKPSATRQNIQHSNNPQTTGRERSASTKKRLSSPIDDLKEKKRHQPDNQSTSPIQSILNYFSITQKIAED